jgi:hypothetical protein
LQGPAWTPQEDELLREGVKRHGAKWAAIARCLPGRTENAVKNRFNSVLRRRLSMNSDDAYNADLSSRPRVAARPPVAAGAAGTAYVTGPASATGVTGPVSAADVTGVTGPASAAGAIDYHKFFAEHPFKGWPRS